jgi:hypothetical protein
MATPTTPTTTPPAPTLAALEKRVAQLEAFCTVRPLNLREIAQMDVDHQPVTMLERVVAYALFAGGAAARHVDHLIQELKPLTPAGHDAMVRAREAAWRKFNGGESPEQFNQRYCADRKIEAESRKHAGPRVIKEKTDEERKRDEMNGLVPVGQRAKDLDGR